MSILKILHSILRDERGTSAVEYGLICCMMIFAMLTALNSFANSANSNWGAMNNKVTNATQQAVAG
jgi:pilus assembly protein Flp/PilA